MKEITTHHDGHGLNESLSVRATDEIGPGNSHHSYGVYVDDPSHNHEMTVAEIQFQKGPRNEKGSVSGCTTAAILAILIDHLQGFQQGPYASRETALVITKLQEALFWTRERADERARRNVLGTYAK